MSPSPRAKAPVWLIALVATLAALLLMSNVLLWRIVDQTDEGVPATRAAAAVADEPLLPAPTPGQSNKASAAELDRIVDQLDRHFAALQADLEQLPGAVDPSDEVAAASASVSGDLDLLTARSAAFEVPGRSLEAIEAVLGRVRGTMADVAGSTSALQADSSRKLQASNDGIDASNQQLGDMSQKLSTSNQGIDNMGAKLDSSNAGIDATNRGLQDMSSKLSTSNARIAETNATLGGLGDTMSNVEGGLTGLREDMQALTAKMDALVAVACSVPLGAPPAACSSPGP
jgi:chromosome segregation ATPase